MRGASGLPPLRPKRHPPRAGSPLLTPHGRSPSTANHSCCWPAASRSWPSFVSGPAGSWTPTPGEPADRRSRIGIAFSVRWRGGSHPLRTPEDSGHNQPDAARLPSMSNQNVGTLSRNRRRHPAPRRPAKRFRWVAGSGLRSRSPVAAESPRANPHSPASFPTGSEWRVPGDGW